MKNPSWIKLPYSFILFYLINEYLEKRILVFALTSKNESEQKKTSLNLGGGDSTLRQTFSTKKCGGSSLASVRPINKC